jgi:hypothetical protein
VPDPNTLFLIAKHGLKKGPKSGLLESWMWNLKPHEESMSYLSLHKTKTERAFKGGRIVEFRTATNNEVEEHQQLLDKLGKNQMRDIAARKIVVFRVDPDWDKLWPQNAKSHQMAYKATGYIAVKE